MRSRPHRPQGAGPAPCLTASTSARAARPFTPPPPREESSWPPLPRPRRAARGNRLDSDLRGAAARRRRPAAPAVAGALSLLAATLAGFAAAPAKAATGAAAPVVSVSDLSEDYAAYLDGTYDGELAPSPLDLSYLADSLAVHSALRAAELPSSFDLRETNRIGGMLNQHETENCWALRLVIAPTQHGDCPRQNAHYPG